MRVYACDICGRKILLEENQRTNVRNFSITSCDIYGFFKEERERRPLDLCEVCFSKIRDKIVELAEESHHKEIEKSPVTVYCSSDEVPIYNGGL